MAKKIKREKTLEERSIGLKTQEKSFPSIYMGPLIIFSIFLSTERRYELVV